MGETKQKSKSHKLGDAGARDIRTANILAATAVADTVRTSLGPRGMDKMIEDPRGEVMITNDGATILKELRVSHPCAKMLVDLSHSQDIEAGDGTTSVVVTAGALLNQAEQLLGKGIHPQTITEAFLSAENKAEEILTDMSIPVSLDDRAALVKNASTSLNSKVVAQSADVLAPIAVDAVLKLVGGDKMADNVDLSDVRIAQKMGGTMDDTELVDGLVLTQQVVRNAGGPTRVQNAKIGMIQFCLSPPKTDMESNVTVKDYNQMDRILREERMHIAKMVKKIAQTGCNVLLIQKSILRDAVTDLSLDFCAKMKIMVVKDIEREDIDFVSRILGCEPVADLDNFTKEKLGEAGIVYDDNLGTSGMVGVTRFCELKAVEKKCVSILVRGSNKMLLAETERSLHDALCVVRSLVKRKALIPGGAAPEMEMATKLKKWARTIGGVEAICVEYFADALERIPYTLAENAGLNPIDIVTKLRTAHVEGEKYAGINVKKACISDMLAENVVQPLLVSVSIIKMATETVRLILKIDDIVMTR
eukprot:g12793.t1